MWECCVCGHWYVASHRWELMRVNVYALAREWKLVSESSSLGGHALTLICGATSTRNHTQATWGPKHNARCGNCTRMHQQHTVCEYVWWMPRCIVARYSRHTSLYNCAQCTARVCAIIHYNGICGRYSAMPCNTSHASTIYHNPTHREHTAPQHNPTPLHPDTLHCAASPATLQHRPTH